jgi:mono/diheme cytochrome c family protein
MMRLVRWSRLFAFFVLGFAPFVRPALGAAPKPVDFASQILPIFQRTCVRCHGPEKASGGLQLGTAARVGKGGISEELLVPGHARDSYLVKRLRGEGGEERMPMEAKALGKRELALIERWIDEGAVLPNEGPPRFSPAPGGLKRLTVAQYHNTLRDLFGPKVALPRDLEPDTLVAGSATVGAARVALSATGVEKFAVAASSLGAWAAGDRDFRERFVPCAAELEVADGAADESCLRGFVTAFGRRAWRRPLAADEVERYTALARQAVADDGGWRAALAGTTSAFLQSPHFLYRSEVGVPDPSDPKRRRLGDFELASRLSYFLWGAPPDDALLDAALAGKLATEAGLAAEAQRMLRNPLARATMAGFFLELFRLRRLDRISESRTKYPQYTDTIGASLRGETLRLIEEIAFAPGRDFREIFSADFTYVNPELAKLYGVAIPANTKRDAYVRVALPAGAGRGGVLGQGAFLTIFAHATTSSPTKRGKFIRESLLCQAVPPPPPNVETKLPKDEPGKPKLSARQKLEEHRKNPRCNGCHKFMDPLGFAFERFDGIGARRSDEAGVTVDTSGELDGVAFTDAGGLGRLLAKSPQVGACVARSLFRYAVGHLESEGEEPLMQALARGLERDGYNFEALVANVITSEGFRMVGAPKNAPAGVRGSHAQGK